MLLMCKQLFYTSSPADSCLATDGTSGNKDWADLFDLAAVAWHEVKVSVPADLGFFNSVLNSTVVNSMCMKFCFD